MVTALLSLSEEYWEEYELDGEDISFLYDYLLENETPLTSEELMPILVEQRIEREKIRLEKKRLAGNEIYFPKDTYEVGDKLVFPAFTWQKGEVIGIRQGENPAQGQFGVIQVRLESGNEHEFAAGIEDHLLNVPPEAAQADSLNTEAVIASYRGVLIDQIEQGLIGQDDFVQIAGRWFLRALLVDVNTGHLNLAEAVLDINQGGPLATADLIKEVDLPEDVNPHLIEFSMDHALQEDPRFDEVGPAGIVSWFLKSLEPVSVKETPLFLRYTPIEYDPSSLTDEMVALEESLDDELTPWNNARTFPVKEVEVRLIFPHWRAGTLPLSERVIPLFPTAYEAPRIRFTLVDGRSGERFPGWVVREQRYVSGLKEWYDKNGLIPGGIVFIKPGKEPGEVIVETKSSRSTKDWMRTILVGSDGELVFATLKQIISSDFNARMAIMVPDIEPVDQVWERNQLQPPPFEQIVVDTVRELTKLNPQGHVHVTELYAAVNTVRRCPPGPLFALLETRPWFVHVGDLHFRFDDSERL
ncbi:MAG TPA: hypothetical protein ENG59_00650 [Chloroflexi bacterium]|nr:MAG: hypothetical protein DRI46_09510 [Chloroflexota bacterium]HDD54734.1 hypothetical protein [Chloroflexota bacterium]